MRKVKSNNLCSTFLLGAVLTYFLLVQYTPLTDGARTSNFFNTAPLPLLAPSPAPAPTPSTADDLLRDDKREVPTGANPLHN